MTKPIIDVYVFNRKPWRCPDCNVIHRGECPNKALHTLYSYEQRIAEIESGLVEHTQYLEQLGPHLQMMHNSIEHLKKEIKALKKEMRKWQKGGR